MPKGIEQFVAENRQAARRIDATFVDIGGRRRSNLQFGQQDITVPVRIQVYKRQLNNGLYSGHPDPKHGSGRGVSGDVRGGWTLIEDEEVSEDFTVDGRNALREALDGQDTSRFRYVAVGTGDGEARPDDNNLESETGRNTAWGHGTGVTDKETEARGILRFSELGEDALNEFGIFSRGGNLYARITTNDISLTNDEELRVDVIFKVEGDALGDAVITDEGEKTVAKALRSGETSGLSEMAFGTGTATPQESDTSLGNEQFRKDVQRLLNPEVITVRTVVLENEPNSQPHDLTEAAVFDNNGNLVWKTTMNEFTKTDEFDFEAYASFRIK